MGILSKNAMSGWQFSRYGQNPKAILASWSLVIYNQSREVIVLLNVASCCTFPFAKVCKLDAYLIFESLCNKSLEAFGPSVDQMLLLVRLKHREDRAFAVTALKLWNKLPLHSRTSPTWILLKHV